MTNQEVIKNYDALYALRERNEVKFPGGIAYAITRNLKTLESLGQDIMAARQQVLVEHGEAVEDQPGAFRPKEGHIEEFMKGIQEIDKVENDINLSKVSVSSLESLNLSVADMDALYFMVDG